METPSFADLLRRYRSAAGLTQEELADRAGVSARAVSALERGVRRAPYHETVRLLADALGLDTAARAALEAAARRPRSAAAAEDELEEPVSFRAAAGSPSRRQEEGRTSSATNWSPRLVRTTDEDGASRATHRLSLLGLDTDSTTPLESGRRTEPSVEGRPTARGLRHRMWLVRGIAALVGVVLLAGGAGFVLHQRGAMSGAHSSRTTNATEGGRRAPAASAGGTGTKQPAAPTLSVYAGTGESGHLNGVRSSAQFSYPTVLNLGPEGTDMLITDTANQVVRGITGGGLVNDFCGSGTKGYADGPCATAQFSDLSYVARGPDGTVYVVDPGNLRIRAISPAGVVSTLAGSGVKGFADGVGAAAQFAQLGGIDVDQHTGIIYVVDTGNNRVRRITPGGVVTTYAGSGAAGFLDGPATVAQFNGPRGINLDARGNVYIHDAGNHRIRKISPDGVVSTLAGSGEVGYADGPGPQAKFGGGTFATTTDMQTGNLYMLDAGNKRVRKITPDGVVSTVFEFTDPDQLLFNIRISPTGDAFVTDPSHNRIYKITGLVRR